MLGDCGSVQEQVVSDQAGKRSLDVANMKKGAPGTFGSPPVAKKLKQATLSFKCLAPQLPKESKAALLQPKKRKTSDGAAGPQKFAKVQKNDENMRLKCPHRKEDEENEVSSSSEADAVAKIGTSVEKPRGLLERYMRTTQQLEVSTSCMSEVIDLTDSTEAVTEPPQELVTINCSTKDSSPKKTVKALVDNESKENCMARQVIDLTDSTKAVPKCCEEIVTTCSSSKDSPARKEGKTLAPIENKENCISQEDSAKVNSDRDVSPADSAEVVVIEDVRDTDTTSVNNSMCDDTMDDSELASPSLNTSVEGTDGDASDEASAGEDDVEKSPTGPLGKTPEAGNKSQLKSTVKKMKTSEKEAARNRLREEREKKRIEKKRLKEEDRQKKEEARQIKEKLKKEEKERKEAERLRKEKERQEKLVEKEKEREEKQRQREEEKRKKQELLDAKNEEKKRKEEEKEAEKRRKEEEKLRVEEEKTKKIQQTQAVFKNFFKKLDKSVEGGKVMENIGPFAAFEVTKNMRMAPTARISEKDFDVRKRRLEESWNSEERTCLYLEELKSRGYVRGMSRKTYPSEDNDVLVVEEGRLESTSPPMMKAKLLQFRENYRPAYYGTWRKRSKIINPRNPLKKDEVLLDYDVESDDEWEEEEPGESLSHSEGEGEENGSDEEEEEDGFFVPHGYLSDGEGCDAEEEQDVTPEAMKARQLIKAKVWEAEMKKQCQVLKALVIGCQWWNPVSPTSENNPNICKLQDYKVQPLVEGVIMPKPVKEQIDDSAKNTNKGSKDSRGKKKQGVPEEALPHLIKLVHGNVASIQKLIKEFREFWRQREQKTDGDETYAADASMEVDSQSSSLEQSQSESVAGGPTLDEQLNKEKKPCSISKRQVDIKIRAMAVYEKRTLYNYKCWFVNDLVLEKQGLKDLPVPTQWTWITRPNVPTITTPDATKSPPAKKVHREMPSATSTPVHASIRKFTVPGISPQTHPAPSTPKVTATSLTPTSGKSKSNLSEKSVKRITPLTLLRQMAKKDTGGQKKCSSMDTEKQESTDDVIVLD